MNPSIGLVACVALLFGGQDPWVKPPSEAQYKQTPGLVHGTIESAAMKTRVGYSVVLPPDYEKSGKRYPVVYWLHGGGGNENSSLFTAPTWRKLYADGLIGHVILVYPNGFRSGYMDHHDGKVMIESVIIRELIPHIDATYRTVASRGGRAVHGFSMGASGSLKFAIKYPGLFSSAVAYGGGAIDLENTTNQFVVRILRKNLNADPELVRKNNTYHYLEKNHEDVRKRRIRFLLICGEEDGWKKSAVEFRKALVEKKIPCELVLVPGVRHDIRGLIKAEGARAAKFQDEVFKRASSGK